MKAKQRPLVPWAFAAASLGPLSGCQSAPAPEQPPRAEAPLPEQITRRLETVRAERTDFPDFSDVPAPPANVRTAEQWREFVAGTEAEGAALQTWAAGNPPMTSNTPGFVATARSALAEAGPPPPPDQQARTEAFAQRARELARPPAPPQ